MELTKTPNVDLATAKPEANPPPVRVSGGGYQCSACAKVYTRWKAAALCPLLGHDRDVVVSEIKRQDYYADLSLEEQAGRLSKNRK